MELFEAKLETLMLNKVFEELDPKERAYVLKHLTKAAYTNYHFILKNSIEALSHDEIDLVPDPNTMEILSGYLEAKFIPAKTPLFFNIFQSLTLYRSIAILTMVAIISAFFIINKTSEKINTQKPEHTIARIVPIETKEEVDKGERSFPAPKNTEIEKSVSITKGEIEKDPIVNETTDLAGLHVFEPILCLDIDIEEQILCFNDKTLTF